MLALTLYGSDTHSLWHSDTHSMLALTLYGSDTHSLWHSDTHSMLALTLHGAGTHYRWHSLSLALTLTLYGTLTLISLWL